MVDFISLLLQDSPKHPGQAFVLPDQSKIYFKKYVQYNHLTKSTGFVSFLHIYINCFVKKVTINCMTH